jgi:hypothetical protein
VSDTPERPESWYQESPYGPVAAELGLAAIRAVNVLAETPEWRGGNQRRWLPSDHVAFRETIEFAYQAHEAQARLCMPESVRDSREEFPLAWHLDQAHQTLPFSEGERHWLIVHGVGPQEDVAQVVVRETKGDEAAAVMDAGLWRPLDGRGLLDRWWAWRRSVFEFEDSLALDMACKALSGVADIAVPRMSLSLPAQWRAETSFSKLMQHREDSHAVGALIGRARAQSLDRPSPEPDQEG